MVKNVKLGADPELFIYDIEKEEFVSAVGFCGGTKEKPIIISEEGFALQEDNVMLEFNIPPSFTKKEFVNNIQYMLSYINTILPSNWVTKIEPSARFDYKYLGNEQAMTFGCSPDMNAWTMEENPKPEGEATNLRTAGGHIHIGYSNPTDATSSNLIKCLDLFLGVSLAILEPENERKSLYGNFGACRFKTYGVEYRTPSNFWLSSTEMIEFAYEQTMKAIEASNDETFLVDVYYTEIQEVISNNNKEVAYSLVDTLKICNLEQVKQIN